MGTDNQRFKDPAAAREYIKNLAICFEDPNDLSEFLGMCDIVQSVFVRTIIKEIYYEHTNISECVMPDDCKQEIQNEIFYATNSYKNAEDEVERVKQKLKVIISRLPVEIFNL